jgi:hypothetical protein
LVFFKNAHFKITNFLENSMNRKLNKAILVALGAAALAGVSTQASAWSAVAVGTGVYDGTTAQSSTFTNAFKSWADYGAGINYAWAHTSKWLKVQVGTAADIAANKTLDVAFTLKGTNTATGATPSNLGQWGGFSIWTTGSEAVINGAGQHSYAQTRGPGDGPSNTEMVDAGGNPSGIFDYPNYTLNDNGSGVATVSSNVIYGPQGWVGYAQNGLTFTNGIGDVVAHGGAWNTSAGTAVTGSGSSWVEDTATRSITLNLFGLKAGNYLIDAGGVCPDLSTTCINSGGNYAGPNPGANARGFTFSVSAEGTPVPIPAAVWLFGSALVSLGVFGRRNN